MITAGIKDARQHFTEYLSMVEKGEEVIITKHAEPIARIIPIQKAARGVLGSHRGLRDTITAKGKALSDVVKDSRTEEVF